jgi:hypothetical protein
MSTLEMTAIAVDGLARVSQGEIAEGTAHLDRRPPSHYKIHAAAAAEAPILTSITLSPANEHDGQQAGALVDQQPKRRRPKRVIGDTAYGNVEVREEFEKRKVSVLAPVHSTSPKDGTIPKQAFAIDLETDTVTCPEGKTDSQKRDR